MPIYLVETYSTTQSLEDNLNRHHKYYDVLKIMDDGTDFIVVYIKRKYENY